MSDPMYATFDGDVFRPEGAVSLKPNTRVRVIIEEEREEPTSGYDPFAYLDIIRSANLDAPPDWSVRFREPYSDAVKSDE